MSGHSKWATIKHRKGAKDASRAKLFARLLRTVEVAAREGGSDLESNASLRSAYQKARDGSVPLDTIERAIKRGTGELEGVRYEAVSYEGYAPSGIAVIVETLTDNRNRTAAEMRHLFSRNGGSMAEPGAVSWQFERKGVVVVDGKLDEDRLMEVGLDAGLENILAAGSHWRLICVPSELHALTEALAAAEIAFEDAELTLEPTQTISIDDLEEAKKVLRLLEQIDDHDDVQSVHANDDIPDEILAAYEG